MTSAFTEQPLPPWQRAVIKVGSSLLTDGKGGLGKRNAAALAGLIGHFADQGREVLLVSSGAVAAGRGLLANHHMGVIQRQALAAIGQTPMLALWQGLMEQPVAQVLLSHDDLRNRRRYLNAQSTLRELLRIGALPIINENDTVAVAELKLGDNDNLAAAVATMVEADILLIATDTSGLFTGHPVEDPDAKPVPKIDEITTDIMRMTSGGAGELGTGGMYTKLEAAIKCASAGIGTALFCGHDAKAIAALAEDRLLGTYIEPHGDQLVARKQWLRHTPPSGGAIRIDPGAVEALCEHGASLLPGGVIGVEGDFSRDAMVDVLPAEGNCRLARGLVQYQSSDLRRIAGHHSSDIQKLLGFDHGHSVIRREDMVLLAPTSTAEF
ncbi:glutamate 5-kinase [Lysobacter sp. H23M47]|uniref:glutamate 5-kinase n=1 Tax=Lysobacter sp. H23M47 TaxID=2781024 RepID=UPI001880D24B|nr:glutamate 5-kinase [Lysobacter sp. H23M47]QOW25447.1 glutamate 5-kinase [Lysobacter sp. H23M47]